MPGLKHHILGICGFANAGKDTVGDILVTHAGFRKLAFSDALKAEIQEAFHVEPALFVRRELKRTAFAELAMRRAPREFVAYVVLALTEAGRGFHSDDQVQAWLDAPRTPREITQWWGTEYRRRQNPNYWVEKVANRIRYYMDDLSERNFVVTDCRYANEVEGLRALGGWLWQVQRPGLNATTTEEGSHSSATDGTEFQPDELLLNDGDVPHLRNQVLSRFWALDAGLNSVRVEIV